MSVPRPDLQVPSPATARTRRARSGRTASGSPRSRAPDSRLRPHGTARFTEGPSSKSGCEPIWDRAILRSKLAHSLAGLGTGATRQRPIGPFLAAAPVTRALVTLTILVVVLPRLIGLRVLVELPGSISSPKLRQEWNLFVTVDEVRNRYSRQLHEKRGSDQAARRAHGSSRAATVGAVPEFVSRSSTSAHRSANSSVRLARTCGAMATVPTGPRSARRK